MAEILSADPFIYGDLKEILEPFWAILRRILGSNRTCGRPWTCPWQGVQGSRMAACVRCIKPGVDTAGHSFFKMIGAMAGDEHCGQTRKQLAFDAFSPLL